MMKSQFSLKKNDVKTAYGMLLPNLILLSAFVVIPLIYAIYVSFYEWSFYQDNVFVGFQNFERVIKDPLFFKALWVGVKFTLIVIPAQLIAAFLFANLIRFVGGKIGGFVKTSIYVPHVISGVVASIIFIFIYDYHGGLANAVLEIFGAEPVAWLNDIKIALGSISVPAIWLGFGFTTLIMLAGLNDIPSSYYEAAEIDGANAVQKMFRITIPLLKNIFVYLLVVGVTGAIQQFDLPYMMTGGGPLNETTTPNLFIYNHFKNDPYMGYTIASALLLFVILGAISALIFRLMNSNKD
ncbi:MAG TPA: sugar ABC transporter permease [Bacillaceae bacterium]|nr:sugar ABC transporter permease [Paenibacillus bovis]HLU23113.1 sugar ABC transporter permease [Bacillaceae bacterium]